MPVDFDQEQEDIRQKYKDSLWFLSKDLLGYKDLTPGFHYKYMCKKLVEPRKKPIRLLMFPRGHFKTTVLTIAHSIFLQLKKPGIRILIVSGVIANAKSMVTSIGSHYIINQRFRKWFPEYCPQNVRAPETKWTTEEIHVLNRFSKGDVPVMEGTFEAFGPESTITSRHYDYIKLDDLVTRENSTTREQMIKIKEFYKSVFPLKDHPNTPIDVIGTRWDDFDLYGDLLHDDDVEVVIVPAIVDNKPTFPERFTIEYLNDLKKSEKVGTYLFNALYMLDPIPEEDAIFKSSWFKHFDIDVSGNEMIIDSTQERVPIGNTFLTFDSSTEEGKGDFSTIIISTTDNHNNIYVIETYKAKDDPAVFLSKLFDLYEKWKCYKAAGQKVVIENMFMAFIKEKMLRENRFINLEKISGVTKTSKEYRIKSLQPYYEAGKIYHRRGQCEDLEDELIRFPKSRNDDLSDAMHMQLNIVIPSSGGSRPKVDVNPNSLCVWKKKLDKFFSQVEKEKGYALGKQKRNTLVVNESFYG